MGIEDRDYVRRPSRGWGFGDWGDTGFGLPPVCKWLIIANIAVFVLQLLWRAPVIDYPSDLTIEQYHERLQDATPEERQRFERRLHRARQFWLESTPREPVVQQWFELDPQRTLFHGQVWRLLTYAFCHDYHSPWHILMNMWVLWMFGPALERMYGSREFLWFYLVAAVVAALAFVGLAFAFGQYAAAIGASGAVLAVFTLFAWHFPRHTILVFFVIPVEIRWLLLFYLIFDLHPVLQQIGGGGRSDGVAHSAHLGGMAFGFLYAKYHLRLSRFTADLRLPQFRTRWRQRQQARTIRIYQPPPENLDEQVDRILQKIHDHGEPSLTDDERALLKQASQRYKRK